MAIIPPYLKKGDTIGITCPAGFLSREKAQTCIETLYKWGFEVKIGKTLEDRSENYFSGTDAERLKDFQTLLDDDKVNAILCGRGGYGVGRIIDSIDFKKFRKKPKWIIGYSDITVLHSHIHSNFNIVSLHSPMATAFNNGGYKNRYVQSIRDCLLGKKSKYECKPHPFNHNGTAKAKLVGGNLSLLAHLVGTPSDLKTNGKILFLEDMGEYQYNIDRMFYQLKRSGKLDHLAGLILGKFTETKDTERPFGKSLLSMIRDLLKDYDYPVCYDFPVSHTEKNYSLKSGAEYSLKVGSKKVTLEG